MTNVSEDCASLVLFFFKPDGLQESGSPAAKAAEKMAIKSVLYGASNRCTTTPIARFTPNTATTIARRAGGPAIESSALHSGG